MDRNEVEIRLLKEDPDQLILEYQGMIWTIVRSMSASGRLPRIEHADLVQEINRKLLERLPRIRDQFSQVSRLRTYFSVIIRNICLEEFRRSQAISEPAPVPYEPAELFVEPNDLLLVAQEFERLRRVLVLMGQDGATLNVLLRLLNGVAVRESDLRAVASYQQQPADWAERVAEVNRLQGCQKKVLFGRMSDILHQLGSKKIPPDSLRKWYTTRLETCLRLMNGDPPRSAYDTETIGILIERMS